MNVEVNYWAVLLAAISSMVVGALWYSSVGFGEVWMKLAKIDRKELEKNRKNSPIMYLYVFVASLITAYILAHVTFLSHRFFHDTYATDAVITAFWLWLGFTATRILTHDIFEMRRKKLTLLTISHELVTVMVMALIIGYMGVN